MRISKVDKEFDIMKFIEEQLKGDDIETIEDGGRLCKKTYEPKYDNIVIYPKNDTKAERDEVRSDLFQDFKLYEDWKRYGAVDLLTVIYGVNRDTAKNMARNLIKSNYASYEPDKEENSYIELDRDYRNDVQKTINNYVIILSQDSDIKGKIKFNEVTEKAEFDGAIWTDTTDSMLRNLIEKKYGIDNKDKYYNATRIVWNDNRYNPIKELIESTKWDNKPRINDMLCKWLKVEDNPYSHEVSRLIFAGGIYRLYEPGCKFDEMVVLIGGQGVGKSTFVEWLNMSSEYFNDVDTIKGQKGMEAVQGRWICEMGELKAFKEVGEDTAKGFLSRRSDNYRAPYDKYILDHPRKCIFIGTTNNEEFLTDVTGNRRYYPITCNSVASDLFDNEQLLREEILQCWCEAKYLYDLGKISPVFDKSLIHYLEEAREQAEEYDYRKDLIANFLADKNECCIAQVASEALKMGVDIQKKESLEIGNLISSIKGWKRSKERKTIGSYGRQRIFVNNSLPF